MTIKTWAVPSKVLELSLPRCLQEMGQRVKDLMLFAQLDFCLLEILYSFFSIFLALGIGLSAVCPSHPCVLEIDNLFHFSKPYRVAKTLLNCVSVLTAGENLPQDKSCPELVLERVKT